MLEKQQHHYTIRRATDLFDTVQARGDPQVCNSRMKYRAYIITLKQLIHYITLCLHVG